MNSFKTHSVSMIQEIREEDIMSTTAAVKALEGDWQFVSEKVLLALACKVMLSCKLQGWDPVKVTVKHMMGSDWMVACMIPKGKMMANMLKMDEKGCFSLVKFQASQKEGTEENKALEEDFLSFMEAGITNIRRDGIN